MTSRRVEALPADLRALYQRVVEEADKNPEFAAAIRARFASKSKPRRARKSSKHRRAAGVIDPFAVRRDGPGALRRALEALTLEQLKDIVAEHAMDPGKLAMKWRTPERLIDLIVETVEMRRTKGSAFRD